VSVGDTAEAAEKALRVTLRFRVAGDWVVLPGGGHPDDLPPEGGDPGIRRGVWDGHD
jgi:hypothetical protein